MNRRVRRVRDVIAQALVARSRPGLNFHVVNRGADVEQPTAFLEIEIGEHAYTVTVTEDR